MNFSVIDIFYVFFSALEVASCEIVGDVDSLMEKAINHSQTSILTNNTNTMEENSTEKGTVEIKTSEHQEHA